MFMDLTSIGHGQETTARFNAENMIVLDQIEPVEEGNLVNIQFDTENDRAYRVNRTWLTLAQVKAMCEWVRRADANAHAVAAECTTLSVRVE